MRLRPTIRRLHGEQSGAIALLALVGILITFMTALLLYDGGFAVRHKFKAQISADAGAYSQAAVKARVMNDLAYMNVVKRTFLGLWGMYVGMMYQFYREALGNMWCAMSATLDFRFLNWFFVGNEMARTSALFREHAAEINDKCDGAARQWDVFSHEAYGDWARFSNWEVDIGRAGYSAFTRWFGSSSAKFYRTNMTRLDEVQGLLIRTTPKWSQAEAAVRARGSGADKVDSFVTNLPTRRGTRTMTCLRGYEHLDGSIASGGELRREITANRNAHARFSANNSKFKQRNETANLEAGLRHMGGVGCTSLLTNFGDEMAPFIPTQTEAQDYVHTGRKTPLESYRKQHFEFIREWEDLGDPGAGDYEGVSCGQIVDLAPEFRGFRASWAPRIAPVGRCRPADLGMWK